MFISHKYNCIFIHIPKTGGSSVHQTLIKKLQPEHVQSGHYKLIVARKHLKAKMLKPYINKYFTFCFVRNPWSRFISAYNYLLNGGSDNEHPITGFDKRDRDKFISPHKTFNDFILDNSCSGKIYTDLMTQQHFMPQYKYILDSNDNINIDFIGKFENLHEDFNIICNRIGIKTPELQHLNNRPHDQYQLYYTDKTADIIYNTYKEDIDYFDYSFNS